MFENFPTRQNPVRGNPAENRSNRHSSRNQHTDETRAGRVVLIGPIIVGKRKDKCRPQTGYRGVAGRSPNLIGHATQRVMAYRLTGNIEERSSGKSRGRVVRYISSWARVSC
ncbi:hypothetical protein EVAR_4347_1 [Eumeta japonica]|uniref:Uncharacterized protein n=1 Tax=Eumeta variegata TaxID=151549 RepID=A0A4C1VD42_EUMVA|nr:hypothetical protein EVAR_4347_1 [Eumeta japonica]